MVRVLDVLKREGTTARIWGVPLVCCRRVHASRQPHHKHADEVLRQLDQVSLCVFGYFVSVCQAL